LSILSIVKYELRWNLRKKRFFIFLLVSLILETFTILIPLSIPQFPVVKSRIGLEFGVLTLHPFITMLASIAIVMNSFPEEYNSGHLSILFTKPIKRHLILLGKTLGSLLSVSIMVLFSTVYAFLLSWILYGAQSHLTGYLIAFLSISLSSLFFVTFINLLGILTKSSIASALFTFLLYITLTVLEGFLIASQLMGIRVDVSYLYVMPSYGFTHLPHTTVGIYTLQSSLLQIGGIPLDSSICLINILAYSLLFYILSYYLFRRLEPP